MTENRTLFLDTSHIVGLVTSFAGHALVNDALHERHPKPIGQRLCGWTTKVEAANKYKQCLTVQLCIRVNKFKNH